MAALQYVDVPGYAAILFRRTFADLALPGALLERAMDWLGGSDAKWNSQEKRWTFPSGASLSFGYLDSENNRYRYQSAEFQFVGFDELTQFSETQYRYLFSRLRRLKNAQIPLRMRSASNPGGIGHEWVKRRFIDERGTTGRRFIPAKLADNPYLDRGSYEESLRELDPVTRAQLLSGDWTVKEGGLKFQRQWFEVVDSVPASVRWVRFWDLAATEPKPGKDPDWLAGVKLAEQDGIYYVSDVRRVRTTPKGGDDLMSQTASLDGIETTIVIEQEPGASGKKLIDHYQRNALKGFTVYGRRATGSKEVRANPVSSAAQAGNIKLVRGPWISDFLDELDAFPLGAHDDQVDALSGAFAQLFTPQSIATAPSPYASLVAKEPPTRREVVASTHANNPAHKRWAQHHYCQLCYDEHNAGAEG